MTKGTVSCQPSTAPDGHASHHDDHSPWSNLMVFLRRWALALLRSSSPQQASSLPSTLPKGCPAAHQQRPREDALLDLQGLSASLLLVRSAGAALQSRSWGPTTLIFRGGLQEEKMWGFGLITCGYAKNLRQLWSRRSRPFSLNAIGHGLIGTLLICANSLKR